MEKADLYTKHNAVKKNADLYQLLKTNESLLSWGPEEVVLDAGCGPGDVTRHVLLPCLPPDYMAVLGVDISPVMVDHANQVHATAKLAFAQTNVGGDVSHITKLNNKYAKGFSKIFSFYVLNWLPDIEKGIVNLKSLLKPQGQVFLYFPVDRRFQKTYRKTRDMEKWKDYFKDVKSHVPRFLEENPEDSFVSLVKNAGFKVEKCELLLHTTIYPSANSLKGLIESLDPELKRIPDDLKPQYLDACFEVMEDDGAVKTQEDGCVHLVQSCLLGIIRNPVL